MKKALILLAIQVAMLTAAICFGYLTSESKWKKKQDFDLLKCAELAKFDKIEEVLTNQIYAAPLFD